MTTGRGEETAVRMDLLSLCQRVLPSLIKSLQLSERVLCKSGWQSECVHSLPLQTLRSADTDKSAISSMLPSRQRKGERNRGVVLSRREWAEHLCATGLGLSIYTGWQNKALDALILPVHLFCCESTLLKGRTVMAHGSSCVRSELKPFCFPERIQRWLAVWPQYIYRGVMVRLFVPNSAPERSVRGYATMFANHHNR